MAPLPDDFVDSSSFACAWYDTDVPTFATALPELAVDEPVDLGKLIVSTNKQETRVLWTHVDAAGPPR